MRARRAVAGPGLAMLAAAASYVAVLAFPTPLFGYSLRAGRVVVFSRRSLDDRLRPWLGQSLKRIERSSIDDPGLEFTVFELYQPSWYRFFNGPYFTATARHSQLGGRIFVPRFNLATAQIAHADGRASRHSGQRFGHAPFQSNGRRGRDLLGADSAAGSPDSPRTKVYDASSLPAPRFLARWGSPGPPCRSAQGGEPTFDGGCGQC